MVGMVMVVRCVGAICPSFRPKKRPSPRMGGRQQSEGGVELAHEAGLLGCLLTAGA